MEVILEKNLNMYLIDKWDHSTNEHQFTLTMPQSR